MNTSLRSIRHSAISMAVSFLLLLGLAAPAFAESEEQEKILNNAIAVLEEILNTPDEQVPARLLSNAQALIIFPTLVKAGLIFGGTFGQGVASVRSPRTGKWSPPAFLTTMGGSFGFQIGAEAVDLVLMVMSKRGMEGFMKGQFNLGGEIGVAAGPVGRHAEANMDILAQGEIYAYSRSRGAFAGLSLKTSAISFDTDSILAFYGHPYLPEEILLEDGPKKIPPAGKTFMTKLEKAVALAQSTRPPEE